MKEAKMSVIMAQSQYNRCHYHLAPTTKPLSLDGTPNPFGMPWFLMGQEKGEVLRLQSPSNWGFSEAHYTPRAIGL